MCVEELRPTEPPPCWWDAGPAFDISIGDSHPLPARSRAVALHRDSAYVLFDDGRLAVVDASDETAPVARGTVELPGEPADVQIGGRWAWVAAGSAGLLGVDVLHMDDPLLASQLALPGPAVAVHPTCSLAFVAAGSAGLQVVDLTDPEAPVLVSSVPLQGDALSVTVDGDAVLVGTTEQLAVVDASVPEAPFVRSTLGASGILSVASASRWAFLGIAGEPGILIVDLEDLDDPTTAGFQPQEGPVLSIELGPHVLAWAAVGSLQFALVDWCHPTALRAPSIEPQQECSLSRGKSAPARHRSRCGTNRAAGTLLPPTRPLPRCPAPRPERAVIPASVA